MSMIFNFLRVTPAELDSYLNDSSILEDRLYADDSADDANLVEIDKAWDGIMFLLTGQNYEDSDHPLTRVLRSDQFIDAEQDLGYGPGQYLTADEVKEVNDEIKNISATELVQRYDGKKMMELEIYPNVWDDAFETDYLTDNFKVIQELYAEAAKNDEAIITFLS